MHIVALLDDNLIYILANFHFLRVYFVSILLVNNDFIPG